VKNNTANPLIIVRIIGGLGNQMFQYATALALEQHWQCPIKVDIRDYEWYKTHQYMLDRYKFPPAIANAKDIAPFEGFSASLQSRLQGLIPWYQPTYMIYRQPGFCFDDNLIKLRPPLFLRKGYFQSEKFFSPVPKPSEMPFNLKIHLKGKGRICGVRLMPLPGRWRYTSGAVIT